MIHIDLGTTAKALGLGEGELLEKYTEYKARLIRKGELEIDPSKRYKIGYIATALGTTKACLHKRHRLGQIPVGMSKKANNKQQTLLILGQYVDVAKQKRKR